MIPSPDPNLDQLEEVARRLGELLEELTLVGGCAAGLLITDAASASVRATLDVDMVVEAAPTSSTSGSRAGSRRPVGSTRCRVARPSAAGRQAAWSST